LRSDLVDGVPRVIMPEVSPTAIANAITSNLQTTKGSPRNRRPNISARTRTADRLTKFSKSLWSCQLEPKN
jgi:hypothetical protein